ncbi:thymidylate synthase [Glutamicibacter creatinolyticus]|uniref:thymidylate synthase n=1 Tax=Glutamicibacter creatinolyticus TaxID=162496 RepID=UPI003216DC0C
MSLTDHEYGQALTRVLEFGAERPDRTGVGTKSVFGLHLEFHNEQTFPLLTTKSVHFKSVVGELLWMLSGSTDVRELREKYGVTIWDEWEDGEGTIGPGYGAQWRNAYWASAPGDQHSPPPIHRVDQMQNLIDGIKDDPYGRRHIVNAWNVGQLDQMALPPCHSMFQCYVTTDGKVDLQLYQRSSDMFLGLPFNIAQYALLQRMIAQQTGYMPGQLHISIGDAHIYKNHIEQVREQLSRAPRLEPTLGIRKADDLFSYMPEDFHLLGYDPHPAIKAPVAV